MRSSIIMETKARFVKGFVFTVFPRFYPAAYDKLFGTAPYSEEDRIFTIIGLVYWYHLNK